MIILSKSKVEGGFRVQLFVMNILFYII